MRKTLSLTVLLLVGAPAFADTTITVTSTSADCKVSPPEDVAVPVTPSAAAGNAAMQNNNFALARANFRALAQKGDPEGERLYGNLLLRKCTGFQDQAEGVTWLTKASDTGDAVSEAALAHAYMEGQGTAQDDGKAFALLSKAAASGNAPAEVDLGYFYLSGRAGTIDRYQGMVWTVKAGEQGLPAALFNIANAYFNGKALPQDNDRAAYFLFAAMQRSTGQQKVRFAGNINNISRALSADDLKHAAEKARRWSPGKDSLSDVLRDAARQRDTAHG